MGSSQQLLAIKTQHLVPGCLPSSVLKNRPDIMIGLNNVALARAQVGIQKAAFFPSINLTSFIGRASIDLVHLLKLSTGIWIAQAAANSKLLNASAYQNINAARAAFCATYDNYLQTLRAAFADVDNNLTNEQKTQEAFLQAEKAYAAGKRSYNVAEDQYQSGAKDNRDAVNAKINVDRLALALVQEKAQLLDSIVQVYIAVGGGARVGCRI